MHIKILIYSYKISIFYNLLKCNQSHNCAKTETKFIHFKTTNFMTGM